MSNPHCKKAVILAAGCGSRIRSLTTGQPKCLMDLGGRPVIEWILDALKAAGIAETVIVTGFKAGTLKRSLGSGRRYGLRLRYVHNPRWTEPNGISLYAARRALKADDTFLVLMSDHLLPAGIIRKVARARLKGCILAVDTRLSQVFDISDATKIRLADGVPVAIGKKLRKYNAVDCGLFRFDGRMFSALKQSIGKGRRSLTDAVKILIANGDLEVIPVGDDVFWIDIDTPRAYREAKAEVARWPGRVNRGAGSRKPNPLEGPKPRKARRPGRSSSIK
jgi:choline kinase